MNDDDSPSIHPKILTQITQLVMSQIIESTTTASTNRSDCIMWATTLASIICHYCGDMYSIVLPIAIFSEGLVKDVDFSQKGLGTGAMSLVLKAYLSVIQRLGTSCADILRYMYISPPPHFFKMRFLKSDTSTESMVQK